MLRIIILFIALLLLFSSCSSPVENKLKISATTWIGYTPLYYAKEKGWLDRLHIKLLNVSSLSENMYLFKAGNSDAYVGTQYEYKVLNTNTNSIKPIMLFDRSNGGDVVLSNVTLEELQNAQEKIDAYLEMDSVNNTILNDFLSSYNMVDKKINYINEDQVQIASLRATTLTKPTIIVTYAPYNNSLEKNGFKELASTKDRLDLLVIDAMYTKIETLKAHEKQFIALKKLIDKSIVALEKDPQEFYKTVKPYLLDITYQEFKNSLHDIIWINREIPSELKSRMGSAHFPTRDLL